MMIAEYFTFRSSDELYDVTLEKLQTPSLRVRKGMRTCRCCRLGLE